MIRGMSVVASVSLALLLGVAPAAHAGSFSRAGGSPSPFSASALADGQTPPVPDGFSLSDFAADGGFESGTSGFVPGSALDGTVALTMRITAEGTGDFSNSASSPKVVGFPAHITGQVA